MTVNKKQPLPIELSTSVHTLEDTDFVEKEVVQYCATRILITVHGIRDDRAWTQTIRTVMKEAGFEQEVCSADYKWVDAVPFILGIGVAARKREVVKKIRDYLNDFPNAVVDVLCHSNGTKLLCSALEDIQNIKIQNLILAGSICRSDDMDELLRSDVKIEKIWNECGMKDRWPIIAEALRPDLYEQTGVIGFASPKVDSRFYQHLDHGGAITVDHLKSQLLPILKSGVRPGNADLFQFPKFFKPSRVRVVIAFFITVLVYCSLPYIPHLVIAAAAGVVYYYWMIR